MTDKIIDKSDYFSKATEQNKRKAEREKALTEAEQAFGIKIPRENTDQTIVISNPGLELWKIENQVKKELNLHEKDCPECKSLYIEGHDEKLTAHVEECQTHAENLKIRKRVEAAAARKFQKIQSTFDPEMRSKIKHLIKRRTESRLV